MSPPITVAVRHPEIVPAEGAVAIAIEVERLTVGRWRGPEIVTALVDLRKGLRLAPTAAPTMCYENVGVLAGFTTDEKER